MVSPLKGPTRATVSQASPMRTPPARHYWQWNSGGFSRAVSWLEFSLRARSLPKGGAAVQSRVQNYWKSLLHVGSGGLWTGLNRFVNTDSLRNVFLVAGSRA